jgi:hypothetical protein
VHFVDRRLGDGDADLKAVTAATARAARLADENRRANDMDSHRAQNMR